MMTLPLKLYLPDETKKILKLKSEESGLPISRLIAIAIDNELDSPSPFTYLCSWPINEYIEYAYVEEAQKIYQYLLKFPSGIGRDLLMLHRRDIGVTNRNDLMLALRELLEKDMIEEIPVPKNAKFKKYKKDYKYIRLKHIDRASLLKRKRKKIDGSPSLES